MRISQDFFNDLFGASGGGTKFTDLTANGFIQNSANRIQSREERLQSNKADVKFGESAIAFLLTEPDPGGAKFFESGNFDRNFDAVANQLGGLMIFKDINRLSQHTSLTIDGQPVDLGHYKMDTKDGGAAAAKFVLCAMKDSGLSPAQAFKALQALCRFQYVQGECSRPMAACMVKFAAAEDPDAMDAFSKNVLTHVIREGTLAINMLASGSVEMNAGVIISEKIMDRPSENRGTAPHCRHAYGAAFTSAICDPAGNHELKSSMIACHV
jgi:hypothetical protein